MKLLLNTFYHLLQNYKVNIYIYIYIYIKYIKPWEHWDGRWSLYGRRGFSEMGTGGVNRARLRW